MSPVNRLELLSGALLWPEVTLSTPRGLLLGLSSLARHYRGLCIPDGTPPPQLGRAQQNMQGEGGIKSKFAMCS